MHRHQILFSECISLPLLYYRLEWENSYVLSEPLHSVCFRGGGIVTDTPT